MLAFSLRILALLWVLSACTTRHPQYLIWRQVQNQLLPGVRFTESAATSEVSRIEGKSEALEFRIIERSTSEKEADVAFAGAKATIMAFYKEHMMPYAGMASPKTACPSELQPEELSAGPKKALLAYANARKAIGVCESSSLHYAVLEMSLHCRGKTYEIRIFDPAKTFDGLKKVFSEFQCMN